MRGVCGRDRDLMGNQEGDPLESGLKRIVFASRNRGKIKEIQAMLTDLGMTSPFFE